MAPSYDTIGFLAREAQLSPQDRPCAAGGRQRRGADRPPDLGGRFLRPRQVKRGSGAVAPAGEHRPGAPRARASHRGRRGDRRMARHLPPDPGLRATVDAAALHRIARCRSRLGHQGTLRGGGANQLCRGRCRAQQAQGDRAAPRGSPAPGTVLVLPTTPTLPPEREISRWRVVRRVPHANARLYLPRRPCRPAADLDSRDQAAGCPIGLSFIGWRGGDEALLDLAVTLAHMPNASSEGEASP